MKRLDLTLPTPEENLACDEALLDLCEKGSGEAVLRFWEPTRYFVVMGYSNSVDKEVNLSACHADNIPVLRRCSGGGTVVQGPGCLNYALILRIEENGPTATISSANRFIMQRNRDALASVTGTAVEVKGHTDLVIGDRKCSGNSQRRLRHCLLFHGCFLLDLDLSLVERYLLMPSRAPAYRMDRPHNDFLVNLGLPAMSVKKALANAWRAADTPSLIPFERIKSLCGKNYSDYSLTLSHTK